MKKSIYLIMPRTTFPNYWGFCFPQYGMEPVVPVADLAITTVAAILAPRFEVTVCNETLVPIDFDTRAEFIGLSGDVSHLERVYQIARRFRKMGKRVIVGGPLVNYLSHVLRPFCDIRVRGELEDVVDELAGDMMNESWKAEYRAGRPGLESCVTPRWDLYPNERCYLGALQTSRGCPHACDFCHEVVVAGRTQRHKRAAQVVKELDLLYEHGYRNTMIVDDNFTATPKRCAEILEAMADWNRRPDRDKMSFFVFGASLEASRNDRLLEQCASAGIHILLTGLETPNEQSLEEVQKTQNLSGGRLVHRLQRVYDHGIAVAASGIVGFDHDEPTVFQEHFDLIMASSIPIYSVSPLNALRETPLYDRIHAQQRLSPVPFKLGYYPWYTNMIAKQIPQEDIVRGMKWLLNNLYAPRRFGERVCALFRRLEEPHHDFSARRPREVETQVRRYLEAFAGRGPEEQAMWTDIARMIEKHPRKAPGILTLAAFYPQIRYMMEKGGFWDPSLAAAHSPFA